MTKKFRARSSKIAWGFFWLLIAGLILANYFGGFIQLSVWSIIIAAIAMVVLFHCLATLSFASIPIPLAALYYVFQIPLGLPFVAFWTLALVTVLLTIGMHILLPRRFTSRKFVHVINEGGRKRYDSRGNVKADVDGANAGVFISEDDADIVINGNSNGNYNDEYEGTKIEEGDDANNPYISVSFGYASRYLHADNLTFAELNCSFGGMEVYFDNVTLNPDGAEINVNCSFGSIEVYVPSHWRVIDEMNVSLANAEVSRKLQGNDANAPTVKVTGSASLGNVEVKRIKGD